MRHLVSFRVTLLALVVVGLSGAAALAQSRQESLADIKRDLQKVNAEVQGLRQELSPSGASAVQPGGGNTAQQRMDAIEAALQTLTAQTEQLQNRINQVVSDGTNRIGDLQYRVTELEGGDPTKIGKTKPLGTGSGASKAPVRPATGGDTQGSAGQSGITPAAPPGGGSAGAGGTAAAAGGQELAIGEQSDFDKAKAAFDAGKFKDAAGLFGTFAQTYTGGRLTGEALFFKGEALSNLHDTANAARSYLDSFSSYPKGPRAADALTKLGVSLGKLGQTQDACTTLGQVSVRYPAAPAVEDAATAMQSLGCK